MTSIHHEPDDLDIAQAMRARRLELGLDVPQMARAAGVTVPTWRNYEAGRTQVRSDKQAAVWDALGWEPPTPWYARVPRPWDLPPSGSFGWGPGSSYSLVDDEPTDGLADAMRTVLAAAGYDGGAPSGAGPDDEYDADRTDDAEALGIPPWDDIPEVLARTYSPLLARTLDERAARCFAVGAHVYDGSLTEDLDYLAAMPRGSHLGELDETHIGQTLPQLWLTRYDYELVYQLRSLASLLSARLCVLGVGEDEALACTPAEILVIHDVFLLGAALLATRGVEVGHVEMGAWVEALCGPGDDAQRLIGTAFVPPADDPDHFDNWFTMLPEPFVPHWVPAQEPPERATVTPLHAPRR